MREFVVHAHHLGRHAARRVREVSFEAAAVAYIETWAESPADAQVVVLAVRDLDDGRQHCFHIDFESGVLGPCE